MLSKRVLRNLTTQSLGLANWGVSRPSFHFKSYMSPVATLSASSVKFCSRSLRPFNAKTNSQLTPRKFLGQQFAEFYKCTPVRTLVEETAWNGRAQPGGSESYKQQQQQKQGEAVYAADWTVHELLMVTCSEMWDDRPEGAQVIVGYIDTAASLPATQRLRMPTVLVLPSGVSQGHELRPLLDALVGSGFRLIMPSLMGNGVTHGLMPDDETCFTYQLGEQSSFILDFLNSLSIKRVDLALGHSLGCFPLLTLAAHFSLFGSIALIDPLPGHRPACLIEPLWLTWRVASWLNSWLFRPFAWLWLITVLRWPAMKLFYVSKLDLRHLQRLLRIMLGINYSVMDSFAGMIEAKNLPLLCVYSDLDKHRQFNGEFVALFGITSHNVDDFDKHSHLVTSAAHTDDTQSVRYVKRVHLSDCNLMNTQTCTIVLNELRTLYDHRIIKHS